MKTVDDDRRRVACGADSLVMEGRMIAVPIVPAFHFNDPEIGVVTARGALLARRWGKIHAYANLCRHIPLSLDMGDGEVATADGRHFLCHHHGARYRIEDGGCISGPCDGASLVPIDVEVIDGELFLVLPPEPVRSESELR